MTITDKEVIDALKVVKSYCNERICERCCIRQMCDLYIGVELHPYQWSFEETILASDQIEPTVTC